MNARNLPDWIRTVSLGMIFCTVLHAAPRVFTDTTGRTFRGELVSTEGEFVTIKREDGQTFKARASAFSQADIEYFKKNGLKETSAPTATKAAGTPASTAPLRLGVKIFSGKQEQNAKSYYEKEQKISYRVEIKNTEPTRSLEKGHGTLLVFAKVVRYNDQTQVVSREEFDCEAKALETFNYEMKKPVHLRYWADAYEGLRASGYLFVLKDPGGKVLNVTGSSETVAKNYEAALKLKLNQIFTKDYKYLKDGSTSYID